MYKVIDKMPKTYDVERWGAPIVVLEDEYGGQAVIHIDDHCFVLMLGSPDRVFNAITHWFPEAVSALKDFLVENPDFRA